MDNNYAIITCLTDPALTPSERKKTLKHYADENNWLPSDEIDEYPGTENFSNGHLIVEHGLNNTAVITFLKRNHPYGQLTDVDKIRLLSISYNNLVEWHFFPDQNGLTCVFNRMKSLEDATKYYSINEVSNVWRAEAFDRITEKRPNPNIKSLDNALIETITFWKKVLASELKNNITNENISTLFNSIIFARALEDDRRRRSQNTNKILVDKWLSNGKRLKTIRACILYCIREMGTGKIPLGLFDEKNLKVFDALDYGTVLDIFKDFYINKYASYHYDFSLMSKHALSRIYERYVSLLSQEESPQTTMFPDLPKEIVDRTFGGIYTPQYIARFFARYLKENLTPVVYRNLKTVDPACGSGIFLRTILEMQCDPFQEVDMSKPTADAFSNVLGIDRNENACQATRLSLYLLHLVLTDKFPSSLNIINSDAISYFNKNKKLSESYDVVIANPPFIKWENIDSIVLAVVKEFMADYGEGKVDIYQAFLKLGMCMVKEGGYLCYVLPHSFLISKNALKLRKEIISNYNIHYIVDLSEIDVFEGVGAYVILLIMQKKKKNDISQPKTVIVRCREYPGQALQMSLEDQMISTDFYEIYKTDQSMFSNEQWQILTPRQILLQTKLKKHSILEQYLTIRVGFNTGANDIFIRNIMDISSKEKDAYIPYLNDRDMQKYSIPSKTHEVVFYPYIKGKKINQKDLISNFSETWKYLNTHSRDLKKRDAVIKGNCEWWSPERSRLPENMLRPKIITPHFVLLTKFSLDSTGKYGISRSPLMYLKHDDADATLLYYFLAILNSSVVYWQIAQSSHKYSHGYFMLEPKTLKKLYVPDPSNISPSIALKIQRLVERRIKREDAAIENEIDCLVADLYGLSNDDKKEIGLE